MLAVRGVSLKRRILDMLVRIRQHLDDLTREHRRSTGRAAVDVVAIRSVPGSGAHTGSLGQR